MTSDVKPTKLVQDSRLLTDSDDSVSGVLADSELDAVSGGTLIEPMVVIAIIGILIA